MFIFYVHIKGLEQQSIEKEKVKFEGCRIYANHAFLLKDFWIL